MQLQKAKKKYACLIIDADHTLLDYIADEYAAFTRLYEEMHVPVTKALLAASRKHSEETWTNAGMYDVDDPWVQREYHNVYRSHVEEIFQKVYADFPDIRFPLTPKTAGKKFLDNLCFAGTLLPYAEETLKALSDKTGGAYAVCIATNGITPVQTGRLARFKEIVRKIYISENLGVIKPLPPFFEKILTDMGVRAEDCLMIGDSLRSDIAGAKRVGLDSCWFNPDGRENATPYTPDYQIRSLDELLILLND